MVKTASAMLALGTKAPTFALPDVISQKTVALNKAQGKVATVVMFLCNHCPFVRHINSELPRLAQDYSSKGVGFVAINSNDVNQYPDDSPANMKKTAEEFGYNFPYVFDETQEVAQAYQATCTPDFFVFDHELSLAYRGQLDDSRPGNAVAVTGKSLREALDALILGQPLPAVQKPSLGCNIKWK